MCKCETCGEYENITDAGEGEYYCNECSTMFTCNSEEEDVAYFNPEEYLGTDLPIASEAIPDNFRELCYHYEREYKDSNDIYVAENTSLCRFFLTMHDKKDVLDYLNRINEDSRDTFIRDINRYGDNYPNNDDI